MQNEPHHTHQNKNEADRKNNAGKNELNGFTFLEIPFSYTFFLHTEKRHQGAFNDLNKSKLIVIRHWAQSCDRRWRLPESAANSCSNMV
jgi:hypothetical protein